MNKETNISVYHEACCFNVRENRFIECTLCPHQCLIPPESTGRCRVRKNINGTLVSLNYGRISAEALDPIEKKPLYHFYPGSTVYSIGTYGCNMHCLFCQNWPISQGTPSTKSMSLDQAVQAALSYKDRCNCIGIAYTYSEPVVWHEYVLDTAQAASGAGLKNIYVSNGFIQQEPLKQIIPWIDAMNIDLKAYTEDFYQEMCSARLDPVKDTILYAADRCHLELTVLIIPGKNDSLEEIQRMTDWISAMDSEIPVHFSRYFPQYKLSIPPTSVETMEKAYEIARQKLDYVYVGNIPGHRGMNTYCPSCAKELIRRTGEMDTVDRLSHGICPQCGKTIRMIENQ